MNRSCPSMEVRQPAARGLHAPPAIRTPRNLFLLLLLLIACAGAAGTATAKGAEAGESLPPRVLVIERVEISGNSRTASSRALAAAGLRAGEAADPAAVLAAADRLRSSGLFREVAVRTQRGSEPGRVIVAFQVKENRPHVRFGVGYEDLSGWYLIPAQLYLDNLSGRGEELRLSTRLGYRLGGLLLSYRRADREDPLRFGEIRLRAEGQERIYYLDATEVRQHLGIGGIDLRAGSTICGPLALETWLSFEGVKADSSAEVYQDRDAQGRRRGDEIPFEELPPEIRDDAGRLRQGRIGLALQIDERDGSGLAQSGFWGRSAVEGVLSRRGSFGVWTWDLRGYLPLSGELLLAARTRAGTIAADAPFYDRFYLGGLYTVRGFPSQSLSPPAGSLNFATASFELRWGWIGPPADPRLVGLAFLDLGAGSAGGPPDLADGAAGIGYGFRLKLPWIGRVGLDIGHPLTRRPVDESFHLNGSLKWTF